MNKKLIASICGGVVVVAAVVAAVVVINNNNHNSGSDGSSTTSSNSKQDNSTVLWSKDGVDIKKATIEYLGEGSFNIITIFANNNDHDVEFDNSLFRYELADGYVITPPSSTKTLSAKRPYIQFAQSLSKEENSHLKVGDTLTVYYGDTKLQTTTISDF